MATHGNNDEINKSSQEKTQSNAEELNTWPGIQEKNINGQFFLKKKEISARKNLIISVIGHRRKEITGV